MTQNRHATYPEYNSQRSGRDDLVIQMREVELRYLPPPYRRPP